jgi:hypothetical protein
VKSSDQLAREIYDAEIAPDEFERRLRSSLASADEMAEVESLIRWFSERYPTARERLAYAKRRAADLRRHRPR